MLKKREVDELARYLGLWGAWGGEVVVRGDFWEVRGLPKEAARTVEVVEERYRLPLLELVLLAGNTLEPTALRILGHAGTHKGWPGMVEAARAIGILRRYRLRLGQEVKAGEPHPVA